MELIFGISSLKVSDIAFNSASRADANRFVNDSNDTNKNLVQKAVARSLGVDFATILDQENVRDELDAAIIDNVALIKRINSNHWSRVIQAVNDNFAGIQTQGQSLTERLRTIGGISKRQAKFIARDQTAKLATSLTEIRHKNSGINEYVWSNSQDERVVGNKAGLYPTGNRNHGNHWVREGKKFRYDKPPHDGNPGHAPGCRCVAKPVIELDKLDAIFV